MKVLESPQLARLFYRERYGLDITVYSDAVRLSLENLYFRGVRLSTRTLYDKLAQCGIEPSYIGTDITRYYALARKVQAEPPCLSHEGARFWYSSQPRSFSTEEIRFLAQHFPKQMQRLYPSLWKAYMLSYTKRNLPDYVESELFDSDECIFQQGRERNERQGDAALTV